MKLLLGLTLISTILLSCNSGTGRDGTSTANTRPMVGTWRLLTGTLIEKGDTTVTDYTKNRSFIKIINNTHFAFLLHDLTKGKDSAVYSSGGGRYSMTDRSYVEHLEYCTDRNWEGHDFTFTVAMTDDTLTQTGVEKIEKEGINRLNIERYVRVRE